MNEQRSELTKMQKRYVSWTDEQRRAHLDNVKANAEKRRPPSGRIIYGIWDKAERRFVYVGETTTHLQQRIANHRNHAFNVRTNTPISRAFRDRGWDNFEFRVIDDTADPLLDEAYYVAYFGTYENGYNATPDGKGRRGKQKKN